MYSKEDREWALYVLEECGGGAREAGRITGICPTTISRWASGGAEPERPCKKAVYLTCAEKVALVEEVLAGGDAADVAARAGVARGTLEAWRRSYLREGAGSLMTHVDGASRPRPEGPAAGGDPAELAARVHELELRNAVLEQTIEILKKDPGADPSGLTNREKAALVGALRGRFPLRELLGAVGLARSTYFYQARAMREPDKYAWLREAVAAIFRESNATWGYRRIWGALRTADEPVVVSEKVVRDIMREDDLVVIYHAKKKNWSSYRGEESPAPPNLVGRDFSAGLPNFLWLTDITQFALPRFKCYLSPVIDCFDGAVVAWRASRSPNAELVNSMLDGAVSTLSPGERPVLHNDRGIHYRWPGWIERCEAAGITRSMSRKGCSPDNSACEGFFGRLKNEFFYHRDWEGVTFEGFVAELGAYIEYYNEGRIKQSLGWKSPMQYRRSLGLAA